MSFLVFAFLRRFGNNIKKFLDILNKILVLYFKSTFANCWEENGLNGIRNLEKCSFNSLYF